MNFRHWHNIAVEVAVFLLHQEPRWKHAEDDDDDDKVQYESKCQNLNIQVVHTRNTTKEGSALSNSIWIGIGQFFRIGMDGLGRVNAEYIICTTDHLIRRSMEIGKEIAFAIYCIDCRNYYRPLHFLSWTTSNFPVSCILPRKLFAQISRSQISIPSRSQISQISLSQIGIPNADLRYLLSHIINIC